MTEDKKVTKALGERRRFTIEQEDGSKKEYFLGTPTAEDIRQADWEHAKTYNKALREGVFTTSEMMTILESRNIAGPDYERIAVEMSSNLAGKIVAMELETDEEERVKLALEVQALRDDVFRWNSRVSGPLSSTCESIANDARVEYLTSAIIQDAQGERIWETFDVYKSENNLIVQVKAKFEIMMWMEGLESNAIENSPEAVVIRASIEKQEAEDAAMAAEIEKKVAANGKKKTAAVKKTRKKRVSKKPTE